MAAVVAFILGVIYTVETGVRLWLLLIPGGVAACFLAKLLWDVVNGIIGE